MPLSINQPANQSPPTPHPSLTVGLVAHAQDDLRGAVVARDHVGGHQQTCGGGPGQAEVQDFQRAVGLHHDVTGLQVLMGSTGWGEKAGLTQMESVSIQYGLFNSTLTI